MIYCKYCGSKNNEESLYCRGCSAPFHEDVKPVKKQEYLELNNNPYVSGSLALYGLGNYLQTGTAIYYPSVDAMIRTSLIEPNEAREMLDLPRYTTTKPTKIDELPDIKLLDKIKNKLVGFMNYTNPGPD